MSESIFSLIFGFITRCNIVLSELKKVEARLDTIDSQIAALAADQVALATSVNAGFAATNAKLDQIIALLGTPQVSHKVANSNPTYGHPIKSTRRT